MAKVTYLGPDDSYSFSLNGKFYEFKRGQVTETDADGVANVSMLNYRGLSVGNARQYGAQVFDVGSSGAKASGKGGEG